MTKSNTLLPVAISILAILGVVHLYWLTYGGFAISWILLPESFLIDGTLNSYLFHFILVPILSLPLAIFIENLRPKRTVVYCFSALAPAIAFYGNLLLQPEVRSGEALHVILGVAPIFIGLPIAIFVLRQVRRRRVPSNSLH